MVAALLTFRFSPSACADAGLMAGQNGISTHYIKKNARNVLTLVKNSSPKKVWRLTQAEKEALSRNLSRNLSKNSAEKELSGSIAGSYPGQGRSLSAAANADTTALESFHEMPVIKKDRDFILFSEKGLCHLAQRLDGHVISFSEGPGHNFGMELDPKRLLSYTYRFGGDGINRQVARKKKCGG